MKFSKSNIFLFVIISIALIYAATLIKLPTFGQKIAVIDTKILVMAVSTKVNDELASGKINLEQSQLKILNHIDEMYEETKKYAENGYTIIPSQNTIFYSDKHDITEEIAKKIGVDYDVGLQQIKEKKVSNTNDSAFAEQLNNQSIQPDTKIEDYTGLELTTNNGQTTDLELFE